jgi:hypothetical protein
MGISLPLRADYFLGWISMFTGDALIVFFMKMRLNLPYFIVLFIRGAARDNPLILFRYGITDLLFSGGASHSAP